jgi:hypothetical protein
MDHCNVICRIYEILQTGLHAYWDALGIHLQIKSYYNIF